MEANLTNKVYTGGISDIVNYTAINHKSLSSTTEFISLDKTIAKVSEINNTIILKLYYNDIKNYNGMCIGEMTIRPSRYIIKNFERLLTLNKSVIVYLKHKKILIYNSKSKRLTLMLKDRVIDRHTRSICTINDCKIKYHKLSLMLIEDIAENKSSEIFNNINILTIKRKSSAIRLQKINGTVMATNFSFSDNAVNINYQWNNDILSDNNMLIKYRNSDIIVEIKNLLKAVSTLKALQYLEDTLLWNIIENNTALALIDSIETIMAKNIQSDINKARPVDFILNHALEEKFLPTVIELEKVRRLEADLKNNKVCVEIKTSVKIYDLILKTLIKADHLYFSIDTNISYNEIKEIIITIFKNFPNVSSIDIKMSKAYNKKCEVNINNLHNMLTAYLMTLTEKDKAVFSEIEEALSMTENAPDVIITDIPKEKSL
mgnify:CR=1 FL=1